MNALLIDLLVCLYPGRWRERYAEEFVDLLRQYPLTMPTLYDVIKEAFKAHLLYGRTARRQEAIHRQRVRRTSLIAFLVLAHSPVALSPTIFSGPSRSLLP